MEIEDSCQEICRLCDQSKNKLFSLFGKNEQGQQIIHLIQECLPIIVYRTDPLSKLVCEHCLENLNKLNEFKKKCSETANRNKEKLRTNGDIKDKTVQLYLGCEEENNLDNDTNEHMSVDEDKQADIGTSTEDLTILCSNCRSEVLDAHKVNSEIELCAELHKAIADSFSKNKIICESESDKVLRSRRKRSQAFYHELDDSMCSSLTEFTNTESSQCFEFQSDMDSIDSDDDDSINKPSKRRRIEEDPLLIEHFPIVDFDKIFEDDVEYRYYPLSLMSLCLNVINQQNVPDYEPDDFKEQIIEPQCTYCQKVYKNSKLLALHEINHMNIEMGEKVDTPNLWHESRDDSFVRNRWLTSEDTEFIDDDGDIETVEEPDNEVNESLLIPVGTDVPEEHKAEVSDIILIEGKPYVNGAPLSDYSKEERKAFYHSMRIGGVNKRFCLLCRYSFKDNWAIESHYFSMACYYTCRYCGMRFNKQRNRFDEHVQHHAYNGDTVSTKVFAASKNNNVVPKVIYPKKRMGEIELKMQPLKMKSLLQRKSMQPNLQIKEEPGEYQMMSQQSQLDFKYMNQTPGQMQTSQSKTGNQAFFCRKCYKVFFKLDEFNIHSKNCDHAQFPNANAMGQYFNHSKNSGTPNNANSTSTSNGSGDGSASKSVSGRPMRNCVKDAGPYRDELYLPESLLRESTAPPPTTTSTSSPQSYVCYICNTPFPTIYSRNSHMRIHKADTLNNSSSPSTSQPSRYRPYPTPPQRFEHVSVAHLAQVKQEPLEPEVEIHEPPPESYSGNLGPAVSITPISKNPNQRPSINPNVMKLVQSNPQLSIKSELSRMSLQAGLVTDPDRSYKCSSCWEAFANKSHLYFHKKNQCEGSKYPCPFCKKRFGTEAAYSSHIFYSHPE